jgi:hypothetical protein
VAIFHCVAYNFIWARNTNEFEMYSIN